ncbi:Di-sulfide bridge nucleocytoplasmic transport domain-containing protein [Amylostereum chailletii]|nr:Di-sulfide bridge nucleocytoplasmic transport domain-containing protein [Amylostereum chailletii]
MATPLRAHRSTEAPMDYEFTSRPNATPAWKTPQKRPRNDLAASMPSLTPRESSPSPFPTFGTGASTPFILEHRLPSTPHPPAWAPPSTFSPTKAFPPQPDVADVDMAEPSPPRAAEGDRARPVALGGMRRVFKARQASPRKGTTMQVAVARRRARVEEETDEEHGDGGDTEVDDASEDEGKGSPRKARALARALARTTSHHYTLNMPSPAVPSLDTPYVLLGYLQFFFNLSLILLFLYLAVQFILTVQRDVEQRISEYSMDIVQEITNCAAQYKANMCGTNAVPAMMRQCGAWDTCMNRDPTIVGRARVSAELIAEVVNSFVEPISWKTLAFTLSSLAFLTIFINALLSLYRSRHVPPAPNAGVGAGAGAVHHQPSFALPPATPFGPGPYLHSQGWMADEAVETPSRRRRLEGGGAAKVR